MVSLSNLKIQTQPWIFAQNISHGKKINRDLDSIGTNKYRPIYISGSIKY